MIYEVVDKTNPNVDFVYCETNDLIEAQDKLRELEDYYWGEDTEPKIEVISVS